jgi:hypothetical protein
LMYPASLLGIGGFQIAASCTPARSSARPLSSKRPLVQELSENLLGPGSSGPAGLACRRHHRRACCSVSLSNLSRVSILGVATVDLQGCREFADSFFSRVLKERAVWREARPGVGPTLVRAGPYCSMLASFGYRAFSSRLPMEIEVRVTGRRSIPA